MNPTSIEVETAETPGSFQESGAHVPEREAALRVPASAGTRLDT
jgi:hypothetical protein